MTAVLRYFVVTLVSSAPLCVAVLFLLSIILNYAPGLKQNLLESIIFWFIGIGIMPLSAFAVLLFRFVYMGIPFRQLFRPTQEWGPSLNENRGDGTHYALLKGKEDGPKSKPKSSLKGKEDGPKSKPKSKK